MDESEPLSGFPPLFDDDAFEAVRRRMELPSRQSTTHDVREVEGQRQEWYPESGLERHHPHVVERLVLLWGFPECGAWLDSLVIDWRGNRNGFKREVMDELLFLHALFPHIAASSPSSPDSSAWLEAGRYMR